MKLDPSYLPFITKEELRILATIELGMRNHEYVPIDLICKMVKMRGGQGFKTVRRLLKNKMIVHIGGRGQGYKLTFLGYDYLALTTFIKRGLIKTVLSQIGVGKQSDIYKCLTPDNQIIVLKLTRLGRNSFRSIQKNRQYVGERKGWNWLYMSRLSAVRQFGFMRILYRNGFPTPTPIDTNRHAILMSLLPGSPLCHVQRIRSQTEIRSLFVQSRDLVCKLAENGLIHGDFNEFNLIAQGEQQGGGKGGKIRVIDFPQCVSISHPNAEEYFNRDVGCIYKYFSRIAEKSYAEQLKERQEIKREKQQMRQNSQEIDLKVEEQPQLEKMFDVSQYPMPQLVECIPNKRLDHQFTESNHIKLKEQEMLQEFRKDQTQWNGQQEDDGQDDDGQGDDDGQQHEGQEGDDDQEGKNQEGDQEQQDQSEHEELHEQPEDLQIQGELQKLDLQQIKSTKKDIPKYDQQLHNLISQFQNEDQKEDDQLKVTQGQNQKDMPLTPYEVRQAQKAAKEAKLKKRKEQLTTQQYIREAVKRRGGYRGHGGGKGNFGKRGEKAGRQREIKEGLM